MKRYSILQKKLQELESELNQVFSLPAETPCHQLLSEGIEQRFVFLNNLLSAEFASHPKKPHHLQHIEQRLSELETVFHDWDDFRTSAHNHIDTASTCSCTESCLNDDDGDVSHDDPKVFYDGVVEEKAPDEVVRVEPERVVRRVWRGRYGCVMVGVVLMGLVMVKFFGCFHFVEDEFFLTPT